MLDPARFASKPSFCLQSSRWLFSVCLDIRYFHSSLLLDFSGGSLLPERVDKAKLAQTGTCWTSPWGSLLPVCYGNILVKDSC